MRTNPLLLRIPVFSSKIIELANTEYVASIQFKEIVFEIGFIEEMRTT